MIVIIIEAILFPYLSRSNHFVFTLYNFGDFVVVLRKQFLQKHLICLCIKISSVGFCDIKTLINVLLQTWNPSSCNTESIRVEDFWKKMEVFLAAQNLDFFLTFRFGSHENPPAPSTTTGQTSVGDPKCQLSGGCDIPHTIGLTEKNYVPNRSPKWLKIVVEDVVLKIRTLNNYKQKHRILCSWH